MYNSIHIERERDRERVRDSFRPNMKYHVLTQSPRARNLLKIQPCNSERPDESWLLSRFLRLLRPLRRASAAVRMHPAAAAAAVSMEVCL